jgi:hypothetical protein
MEPLFSAGTRLPRNDIHDPEPVDSQHPQSLTARMRRWLLTDQRPLFEAACRQAEYTAKIEEAEPQKRN